MSLKNKVVSGLKWSLYAKVISQLFSWVSTFIVIRILTPEDYGIMALAMMFVILGSLFSSGGFVTCLVKQHKRDYKLSSQIFSLSLIINIIVSLLVCFFASEIASFYANEALIDVLIVMAVGNIIHSFIIVPSAYLDIDMNFKSKAFSDSGSALVAAMVSLFLAYNDYGYWALVYAQIAMKVFQVLGYQYSSSSRYFFTLNFSGSLAPLKFAYHNQLNGLLWFSYNQMDVILIGRFLGVGMLGVYNVAKDIAAMPFLKVAALMNQVGFSAFASLKEDKSSADYYLGHSLRLISLFAFPVFLGISSISDEIIDLLVGEKWAEAGPIIQMLCFVFPFRMMNTNIQLYVNGLNKPIFNVHNTLIISIALVSLLFWATQISLVVTAMAWAVGFASVFCIILLRLKIHFNLSSGIVLSWGAPFVVSFCMWLTLLYIDIYLISMQELSIVLQMFIKIFIGAFFIVITYYLFFKNEILGLLKKT